MNPIKEFFKKKKVESQFKKAGPGHKLNVADSRKEHSVQSSSGVGGQSSRQQCSEEAQRAGTAALARIEQKQTNSSVINWSTQATKAQAKKELEQENAAKAVESASLKMNQIVVGEDYLNFAVSGVFFKCPLIGPDVLPKKEMREKIKTFLYQQFDEEPGLTSCLIIHTLNTNRDKVQVGIETLSRYLTNIIDNPGEEKYRKIRVNNKAFQERVVCLVGSLEFLTACGFERQSIDGEDYLICVDTGEGTETLQLLKEALFNAEPIVASLDRNLKVLKPAEVTTKINLPNDFFNVSAEELKREQELKTETVEQLTTLRTKAMRERDSAREVRLYKYTLMRVRFPDGIILQGTFSVHEKYLAVREFIIENLKNPNEEFSLLLPGGFKQSDYDSTLLDLQLVPAIVLNFMTSSGKPESSSHFLRPEVMCLVMDS